MILVLFSVLLRRQLVIGRLDSVFDIVGALFVHFSAAFQFANVCHRIATNNGGKGNQPEQVKSGV